MQRKTLLLLVMAVLLVSGIGVAGYLTNSTPTSGEVPLTPTNGPTVVITGSNEVNMTNPFPSSDTVEVRSANGNLTATGSGGHVRLDSMTGTWTNTSNVDVSGEQVTLNPGDKQPVTISGDLNRFDFASMTVDDGAPDFVYAGTAGTTTVTVTGLTSGQLVGAYDSDTNEILDVATADTNGEATFANLPNSEHTVYLRTSDGAPTFNDSSATPSGGQSTAPTQLAVEVNDPDQDDNITVEFTLDGQSVGTDTVRPGETASVSISQSFDGGDHQWSVTATDAYGQSTSQQYPFKIPDTLYVRPVTDASATIGSATNPVTLTFYGTDTVETRTINDGSVDMSGLAVGEEFVVTAEVDGWYERQIILDSLYQQQSVYLLNESASSVENQFVLRDVSGNYSPESTRLYIRREVETSNGTEYRTIAGDYFGASNGFPVILEHNRRYSLAVQNQDGDRRVLGSYVAAAGGTEPLKIRGIEGDPPEADTYSATVEVDTSGSQRVLIFRYKDNTTQTSELDVTVYERGNPQNVTFSDTAAGPVQNHSAAVPLANNTDYVLNWSGERDGQTIGSKQPIGGVGLGIQFPLGAKWAGTLGMVAVVFIAGLSDRRYATHIAMSMVAFVGMLMALSVIDIPVVLWWAATAIAIGGHIRNTQSDPGI